ncbi:GNAT family N-acetyltransferase [Anaeromicrobium sediminis]|uniref:GNAT family N-acetyltransferase n=1 Tax=Anaeromicrobium sediminis TaxID=1478221 RepID=A0A267MCU9_9FIRM|nr:GNAT family N-acetyltransferase [Anaeromicrobium sediminis]PAB57376.1 GNAT family N-acetyltransferase [Anaeromicrobium sediminis]
MKIRRFEKSDLDGVLQLFYDTVHHVNSKDYNKEQLDAWAPEKPNRLRWLNSLEKNITYVVVEDEKIIGFGDLDDESYIDKLFIHKDYQSRGIASILLNRLEEEAIRLGYVELYTEASITAHPFFEKKGYICITEQNKHHNGQIFINYIMKKELINKKVLDKLKYLKMGGLLCQ